MSQFPVCPTRPVPCIVPIMQTVHGVCCGAPELFAGRRMDPREIIDVRERSIAERDHALSASTPRIPGHDSHTSSKHASEWPQDAI